MSATPQAEDEQVKLWNGAAGRAWVETRDVLEGMFKPLEALLVQAVADAAASHVLDIGCGTGATTFAVAHMLGPEGHCTGIDISEPMIAAARARAEPLPALPRQPDAPRITDNPTNTARTMYRRDSWQVFKSAVRECATG